MFLIFCRHVEFLRKAREYDAIDEGITPPRYTGWMLALGAARPCFRSSPRQAFIIMCFAKVSRRDLRDMAWPMLRQYRDYRYIIGFTCAY